MTPNLIFSKYVGKSQRDRCQFLAQRRPTCNFLGSSQILVHPAPATSPVLQKFNPSEIEVTDLRYIRGEVGIQSPLAPKIGPLGLSPKRSVVISPKQLRVEGSEDHSETTQSEQTGPD